MFVLAVPPPSPFPLYSSRSVCLSARMHILHTSCMQQSNPFRTRAWYQPHTSWYRGRREIESRGRCCCCAYSLSTCITHWSHSHIHTLSTYVMLNVCIIFMHKTLCFVCNRSPLVSSRIRPSVPSSVDNNNNNVFCVIERQSEREGERHTKKTTTFLRHRLRCVTQWSTHNSLCEEQSVFGFYCQQWEKKRNENKNEKKPTNDSSEKSSGACLRWCLWSSSHVHVADDVNGDPSEKAMHCFYIATTAVRLLEYMLLPRLFADRMSSVDVLPYFRLASVCESRHSVYVSSATSGRKRVCVPSVNARRSNTLPTSTTKEPVFGVCVCKTPRVRGRWMCIGAVSPCRCTYFLFYVFIIFIRFGFIGFFSCVNITYI